jgi:hypothetical protein
MQSYIDRFVFNIILHKLSGLSYELLYAEYPYI